MASSVVIAGIPELVRFGYPSRDSEEIRRLPVMIQWSFPDFAAGGAAVEVDRHLVTYSIAEQFAAWVSRQAPAMRCDWRLAELLDLT